MKQMLPLIILLLMFNPDVKSSEPEFIQQSQQQLIEKAQSGETQIILDVRSAAEYATGHVPNAINIPHKEIASNLAKLIQLSAENSVPIVVYCRSGHRAGIALKVLHENGIRNIEHLVGDMNAWQEAKRPIEK